MLKQIFESIERWESSSSWSFWAFTITLYSCFSLCFSTPSISGKLISHNNQSQAQLVAQIKSGDQDNFKEMLVKHFPDVESRIELEKRQATIYQKAKKNIKEYQRISPLLKDYQKFLTAEEKSSIDYFHGTGDYAKYQDSTIPPNIFDTRKTFLKKMENEQMREKFLEMYNGLNPIE